jgi:hypothetical protein
MNLFLGPTKAWYVGVRFDDLRLGERITWRKGAMGWNWAAWGERRRGVLSDRVRPCEGIDRGVRERPRPVP